MEEINIDDGIIRYEMSLSDGVSASTQIKDVICIGYLYTGAGSNPREFQGMTPTNIKILRSILDDPQRFWAKHLGIVITIKSGTNEFDKNQGKGTLQYEEACITNGLQTLSLFRILMMIKIFQKYKGRKEIHQKITKTTEETFQEIIKEALPSVSEFFLSSITISQINKVLYWFYKNENSKYLDIFNKLTINKIIEIRISFKAVLLDEIISSEEENDLSIIPKWGENIANSNNETQNVKIDDKFGTKYSKWFNNNIMQNINSKIIDIEYRKYSIQKQNLPLKHILDILRAIIPTTLIVDYKFSDEGISNVASMISKYANNRTPVFSVFEKLIKIADGDNVPKEIDDVIKIVKNLMPKLIETMLFFEAKLNNFYRNLTFEEVLKNTSQDLNNLKTRLGLEKNEANKEILDKAVKRQLSFSPSNVFPLFIFATRKSIIVNERLQVEYVIDEDIINSMIKAIYRILLKQRISRQYGSTSDLFRDPELYIDAEDIYELIRKDKDEFDYTEKYRVNLVRY